MGEGRTDRPERLTVAQCSDRLGISEDAVRSRIKRGTLRTERVAGVVHVLLDADQPTTGKPTDQGNHPAADYRDELIAVLREQLDAEREARRRADHIIAALTERIPELEAPPQTPQEADSVAESASEGESGGEDSEGPTEPQSSGERVPWWRKLFGRG